MAAPTPPFRSRETSSTRGSPEARTTVAVPSLDASSTTRMRSTNSGMPASVVPTSPSSSWAGMTTATRFPSTIGLRGAAAREERIGEQRGRRAEQKPEQRADEGGVTPARRGGLDRNGRLDDPALLDTLGQREELPSLQELRLHRPAPLLVEADRRVDIGRQEQPLREREILVGEDGLELSVRPVDTLVDLLELLVQRRDPVAEHVDLVVHVVARRRERALRKRVRRGRHPCRPTPLDPDLHEWSRQA